MSRRSELQRLQGLVEDVRAGRSRTLVATGPAGIGKSWLCGRAVALAEGFTVVRTRGLEREAQLGYGGLFDVLTPLLDGRLDRLLPARADALRGALRIAAAAVVDPFAVAVASLDLLALAAEEAPLLVVVDDAQWVDAASLEALRFAARRLDADRVGFLFAARDEFAGGFAGIEALTVGGLDTDEAVGLVNELTGSRVEASVALALAAAGAGHPLWLREAARELTPAQMTGAAPLTDRFSVPAAFARAALELPAAARHALVVLAADEQAPPAVIAQALAELAIAPGALETVLDHGLVQLEAGQPRFSHPLAHAAVVEVATPARRRRAHEALARAWSEAGEHERAAWHLAEAGDGPDADASSALVGVARAARARGAPGAAAEAWRRAIETAPDHALPLRLERARDLARAGRAGDALLELDELFDRAPAAELRADAELLRGQLLITQGRCDEAVEVLEAGAARDRGRDPARAAVMLCEAAFAKGIQGRVTAALAAAEAAVALAGPLGGSAAATAESTLGWTLASAGQGARGYPLLLRHAKRGDPSALDGQHATARLGQFACWMEDYDTARRELDRVVSFARERGLVSILPFVLSALGDLEFRTGEWIAARIHADETLRLADDTGEHVHFAHMVLQTLDAVTGDVDGARAHADVMSAVAAASGSRSFDMFATAGRGLLELGLDHPDVAIVHLSRTRELAEEIGLGDPNMVRWMPDLIESQIRAGLVSEARSTLAEFEAQVQRTGRGWALATAARCRGLLAAPGQVDAAFAQAPPMVSPFERARSELCWGERLRCDGRRVDARRHLHAALTAFEGLGAAPWAERAARELRASGGRAVRGPRARSDELTAQQLQIATMVADGKTNKTIATSLFLSPKTIEFHLSHVYRKLGVANRTQLAHALLTH